MKTFHIFLISIFSFAAITTSERIQAQPGFSVSFNAFYNELSPYGRWLDMPRYGKVWIYSEPGFRPYATNGRWEDTDQGWTWVSDYEWGAIPFHYGRWELDPYYGWIWIPGYDYAPAWVVWSQADDYYGWAPLGFGLDINISFGRIPSNRWMYASIGNITRPRIDRYCMPYNRNRFYYERQQPIINVYNNRNVRYMAGPRRDQHFGNDRNPVQRPPVRNGQYGNNRPGNYNYNNPGRNDYSENDRNRNSNGNIHFDPRQYNRDRAIGSRPSRQEEMNNRPEPRQAEQRPQISQPRINNQSQPQMREAPQRSRENSGGTGSRPIDNRNRRIF